MDSEENFPNIKESEVYNLYEDEGEEELDERLGMITPMLIKDPEKNPLYHRICRVEKEIQDTGDLEACISKTEQRLQMEHGHIIEILDYCYHPLDEDQSIFYFAGFYEMTETDLGKEIEYRRKQGNKFTDLEIYHIIKEIISALSYLQKNNLIHGDLR